MGDMGAFRQAEVKVGRSITDDLYDGTCKWVLSNVSTSQPSRVLCGRGGGLVKLVTTALFPCFTIVNASVWLPPFLFLSLTFCFSFICLLLLPSLLLFCLLCFPPPDCHRLTAVSGPCAVQPRGPASLPGRVMYDWLALTSPRAQRHSNSVLPGLCFLVLSLSASPLFLLLLYPPLITSLFFRFLFQRLFLCAIYCFPPFFTSISLSCPSFFIACGSY